MKFHVCALLFLAPGVLFAQGASRSPQPPSPASATEAMYQGAASSAAQKFDYVQRNGGRVHPDQRPTVFTEREINAYLASGRVKLPKGVRSVRLIGTPGLVQGNAQVDFDAITAGKRGGNPLMLLFTGVHQVEASGHAIGRGGQGQLHIQTVSLDGIQVPHAALEFFIDHYIKPKHPNIGLDSTFKLPERIDTATVGEHTLTITQK